MTTTSCAQRWSAATSGSTCRGCPIGHAHQACASPAQTSTARQRERQHECLRCGRTDLRIVREAGTCISCYNREREQRVGANSKGKAPVKFKPLDVFAVATETQAGEVLHHVVEARHGAEALGRIAMKLHEGERLSTATPGRTEWCTQRRRFVVACSSCGHRGLLERVRRERLHHHCPRCSDAPMGPGWGLARARAPVTLLMAAVLAIWLELTGESAASQWASTQFGCAACGTAVLLARSTADGRVEARCPACGAGHAH
ncbi:hypothetical protein [Variovorax guangxiensis]|uniref:hypothetical protein n=1 Tax=Variovorax guangxiensis TaxID=1775474 RepID=UPI0028575452|nr:hypothetical protein [Variovorax guangxiensis]MDR6855297.1 DNA-directed RNA polymerase subunit RPC12/RpoP [Variovorax guangxiensis]